MTIATRSNTRRCPGERAYSGDHPSTRETLLNVSQCMGAHRLSIKNRLAVTTCLPNRIASGIGPVDRPVEGRPTARTVGSTTAASTDITSARRWASGGSMRQLPLRVSWNLPRPERRLFEQAPAPLPAKVGFTAERSSGLFESTPGQRRHIQGTAQGSPTLPPQKPRTGSSRRAIAARRDATDPPRLPSGRSPRLSSGIATSPRTPVQVDPAAV
jgi:hypothetical protein